MSNNMSISSIKEHYNNLCTKAKEWSAAYYEQDAPVVTDEEYDSVMHEIRDIEAAHPEFVTADSPTQVVGGKRVLGIPVEFYNGIDWESLFEFVRHYYSIGVEYSSRRILVTSVVS